MHEHRYYMKSIRILYGIFSILSLLTGILIYLLLRDMSNMIIFAWLPRPTFAGTVFVQLKPSPFSYVLMYNLPDMLWFLSGILFFRFIWFDRKKTQKAYIFCFYGIGAVIEISQLSERVYGTFDLLDLFFMGLGAFIEALVHNFLTRGDKGRKR